MHFSGQASISCSTQHAQTHMLGTKLRGVLLMNRRWSVLKCIVVEHIKNGGGPCIAKAGFIDPCSLISRQLKHNREYFKPLGEKSLQYPKEGKICENEVPIMPILG